MRRMCEIQLKSIKIDKDLTLMLCFSKTMDQLVITDSVCCDGHVRRKALDLEGRGQRKKGRPKRTLKKQVIKCGLSTKDALCQLK